MELRQSDVDILRQTIWKENLPKSNERLNIRLNLTYFNLIFFLFLSLRLVDRRTLWFSFCFYRFDWLIDLIVKFVFFNYEICLPAKLNIMLNISKFDLHQLLYRLLMIFENQLRSRAIGCWLAVSRRLDCFISSTKQTFIFRFYAQCTSKPSYYKPVLNKLSTATCYYVSVETNNSF